MYAFRFLGSFQIFKVLTPGMSTPINPSIGYSVYSCHICDDDLLSAEGKTVQISSFKDIRTSIMLTSSGFAGFKKQLKTQVFKTTFPALAPNKPPIYFTTDYHIDFDDPLIYIFSYSATFAIKRLGKMNRLLIIYKTMQTKLTGAYQSGKNNRHEESKTNRGNWILIIVSMEDFNFLVIQTLQVLTQRVWMKL